MKENMISFRADIDLKNAIEENAAKCKMNKSAYISEAIYEKINGNRNGIVSGGDELARCIVMLSNYVYNNYNHINYEHRKKIIEELEDINRSIISIYSGQENRY